MAFPLKLVSRYGVSVSHNSGVDFEGLRLLLRLLDNDICIIRKQKPASTMGKGGWIRQISVKVGEWSTIEI